MKLTELWQSDFGNDYHKRSPGSVEANAAFFEVALMAAPEVRSIIEFGAGTGANIRALRRKYPDAHIAAVELNEQAYMNLLGVEAVDSAWRIAVQDLHPPHAYELVLTKGFLIHIPPNDLPAIYKKIYDTSSKYILLCEYFSVQPTMIPYRGTVDTLWKRDHCAELMYLYPGLKLLDYGFCSRLDPVMPQDDLNFWLLLK